MYDWPCRRSEMNERPPAIAGGRSVFEARVDPDQPQRWPAEGAKPGSERTMRSRTTMLPIINPTAILRPG